MEAQTMPAWVTRMQLARQLWLLLVIPIAIALVGYEVIAEGVRRRVLLREASAELRNQAALVEIALGSALDRGEVALLDERVAALADAERIMGIAAFDLDGRPILVTDHLAANTPVLLAIARRAAALRIDFEEQRLINGVPTLVRTVTFSPKNEGRTVIATVVRDLRYLRDLRTELFFAIALTGLVLLVLTAGLVAIVSRATVGRPVSAIVAGVERVASGELDTHVPEHGAEELARLAGAFNAMTSSLREARARAEHGEEARAAAERKLQHAQALAAVGQVAASIAHQIGSPLNVVLGRARRAADLPGCPEAFRGELETIAAQSERISRVVARLLAVARPPESTGRGCALVPVIQETLAFLGVECRQRRVRARFEPGSASPLVALDADRVFQVVFNLCLNAVQAQTDGGELEVRLVSPAKPGDGGRRVAFEVEDRGPGVPESFREHVFEAFFTSKGGEGGTGLGLAIVAGILREAGGSVELRATEHGGACFRVTLPSGAPQPRASGAEVRV